MRGVGAGRGLLASLLDADLEQGVGTPALEADVVGVVRTRMVVAAGPPEDGRLDQGERVAGELGPEQAALVVEADEAAQEPSRRIGVRDPLDLGDQLASLLRRPVLRLPGEVGVGVRRGHRGQRGEHVEGQASFGQRTRECRELVRLRRGLDQGAGPGAADVTVGDQPVAHGQRPVAAPGLRAIELGDIEEHGTLVLGDDALAAPDAGRQLGRTGITAVVPAEGSGPAGRRGTAGTSRASTAGGGWHKGERSASTT